MSLHVVPTVARKNPKTQNPKLHGKIKAERNIPKGKIEEALMTTSNH
jgi:hypothetical protein